MDEQTGSPGATTDNSSQRNGEEVRGGLTGCQNDVHHNASWDCLVAILTHFVIPLGRALYCCSILNLCKYATT